ncbi:hypothetical protein [Metabacillus sp. RGM 3146]|uniref:hypothetical protein n=1 Tax=Metabacillus sp. RGM 3146 TaxID=3401092 RepID=UPI003B9BBB5A
MRNKWGNWGQKIQYLRNHVIKEKELISLVLKELQELSSSINKGQYQKQLESKLKPTLKSDEKKILLLEKEIADLASKKVSLINLLADGLLVRKNTR